MLYFEICKICKISICKLNVIGFFWICFRVIGNTTVKVESDIIDGLQCTSLITVQNDDVNCLSAKSNPNKTTKKPEITNSNIKLQRVEHVKKTFQCVPCEKSFATKQNLARHMLTHTGVKPYQCDICEKSFFQKSNLNTHYLTHTNKKSYQCAICDKSFVTKQSITYHHISLHGGEKRHQCKVCNKSFVQKSNLTNHILTHSGEKPYQCHCGKLFSQRYHLTRHVSLKHNDKKLYECAMCKKSFITKASITYHIISLHNGEKQYKCIFCNSSFASKYSLKRHTRIHKTKKSWTELMKNH